jgi:hypothetical protein
MTPVTRRWRVLVGVVILVASSAMLGCDTSGIGVGVPVGGARWQGGGGSGSGPGVIVMGGPVY